MKILFIPFSVLAGLVAGMLGKKVFEGLWGAIDEQEPPEPEHRELSMAKLIPALALEGAIFRLVKGLTDHGARRLFARATGSWPGEERPEPKSA